jgi:hypothetical protein
MSTSTKVLNESSNDLTEMLELTYVSITAIKDNVIESAQLIEFQHGELFRRMKNLKSKGVDTLICIYLEGVVKKFDLTESEAEIEEKVKKLLLRG